MYQSKLEELVNIAFKLGRKKNNTIFALPDKERVEILQMIQKQWMNCKRSGEYKFLNDFLQDYYGG